MRPDLIFTFTALSWSVQLQAEGTYVYWNSDVHLYDCNGSAQLLVKYWRPTALVYFARSKRFKGWFDWEFYRRKIYYIFGIQLKSKWYFLTEKHKTLILRPGLAPSSRTPLSDNRLFELYTNVHTRRKLLRHLQSGNYLSIKGKNKIKLVKKAEKASSICMFYDNK